ncbi:hypothetical protein H634G_11429 [Metarhizium anisopliae BRIP 53293]|uniref:Uncharacterized protein n=1 Tax=Metarhizium anisopliae BRIP 53293 TaxID=1291518 RepID=A0A0D9NH87_METAN|nr:hypothetical protein H634G_11429 [Metarhizium anisopliae BRIP 53293]
MAWTRDSCGGLRRPLSAILAYSRNGRKNISVEIITDLRFMVWGKDPFGGYWP